MPSTVAFALRTGRPEAGATPAASTLAEVWSPTGSSSASSGTKGSRARFTCCAEKGRSRGSFAKRDVSSSPTPPGSMGGDPGVGFWAWASSWAAASPSKGVRPVSIS